MIEALNTHIAVVAVSCSWRPIDIASVAKFNLLGGALHDRGIENRLVLADTAINVLLTDWNLTVVGAFEPSEDFRDDTGIYEGEDDHKENRKEMKY